MVRDLEAMAPRSALKMRDLQMQPVLKAVWSTYTKRGCVGWFGWLGWLSSLVLDGLDGSWLDGLDGLDGWWMADGWLDHEN